MTTMKKSITPPDDYLRREQLASQQVRDMLDTLRSEKETDNWTFDVGCTTAMEFEIEQITGPSAGEPTEEGQKAESHRQVTDKGRAETPVSGQMCRRGRPF